MAVEVRQATAEEARQRADRIKIAVEATWLLIVEAYHSRDWVALGYGSWNEYCTREFGTSRLTVPREERQETVASLRESGLSLRAIASATQQSEANVRKDLSTAYFPRGNGAVAPSRVTGIDGRSRPAARPRPQPEPLDPESWPTGNDRDMPRPDPHPRPAPVMLTLRTHTGEEVPYPKPQAKATFNETAGDGISWAAWSWNPVTGCLHGCDYCYARAIATRFTDTYPAGFTPLFHDERLDAPANTTIPAAHRDDPAWRRVFVCSMADLYGRWVPDEWIKQVHESMLASPQWEYLLLTKFPARYVGLEIPPGAWVGTSVDEQKRVRIAENAFREINGAAVKWLSLEPLREPLRFSDLSMFDWVVIGAQTETRQPDGYVAAFAPPFEWVARIVTQALDAGCKIHLKPNLRSQPGMGWLNQYPIPADRTT
jgi:protein gp37